MGWYSHTLKHKVEEENALLWILVQIGPLLDHKGARLTVLLKMSFQMKLYSSN